LKFACSAGKVLASQSTICIPQQFTEVFFAAQS